jgi:hypothetical protein
LTVTRFATVRDLFDEFPTLKHSVKITPGDDEPIAFVRGLASEGKLREAAAICAFLLRRREAVWWACECLRSRPGIAAADDQALLAAEHWARSPSEEGRDIAQKWGLAGDQTAPSTWAAHAAGYTSGTLTLQGLEPVRVQKHLTVECARCAVLMAETKLDQKDIPAFLQGCVDAAIKLLEAPPPAGR